MKALKELSETAAIIPIYQFESFYPVILHHLDITNLPPSDIEHPGRRVRLARLSLEAVSKFAQRPQTAAEKASLGFIKKYSQTVWSWIKLFLEEWLEKTPRGELGLIFLDEIWETLTPLVTNFTELFRTRSFLSDKLVLITTMTRMWLVAAQNGHSCMHSLCNSLHRIVVSRDLVSKHFHDTLDTRSTPNSIADIFWRNVTRESQQKPVPYASLRNNLVLLVEYGTHSEPFCRSLLARGIVNQMVYIISRATTRSHPSVDLEMKVDILRVCACFLNRWFDESPFWIGQALEARLIVSIFKSQHLLEHDSSVIETGTTTALTESICIDILRIATPYLIYSSILQSAVRSIKTVETRGLEPALKQWPSLWKAWGEFKQYAAFRKTLRVDYYKPIRTNLCENEKVQWVAFHPMPI